MGSRWGGGAEGWAWWGAISGGFEERDDSGEEKILLLTVARDPYIEASSGDRTMRSSMESMITGLWVWLGSWHQGENCHSFDNEGDHASTSFHDRVRKIEHIGLVV